MTAVNTSNWSYGNWQEAATPSLRLAGLVQHITEVRKVVVEWTGTEGRSQRINVNYLASLEQQCKELRAAINISASFARTSSVPTVVKPQF